MKRTYNQKKALYESIMRNVAKTVKRRINEMSDDLIDFDNTDDITFDMFYDSKLNKSFHSLNEYSILYKPGTNEIGCNVKIRLFNSGEKRTVSIWANSFGELLESLYVVFEASYEEGIFSITTDDAIKSLKRHWYRTLSKYSSSDESSISGAIDVLKSKFDVKPPKTVKDVVKSINSVGNIKREMDDYYSNDIDVDNYDYSDGIF